MRYSFIRHFFCFIYRHLPLFCTSFYELRWLCWIAWNDKDLPHKVLLEANGWIIRHVPSRCLRGFTHFLWATWHQVDSRRARFMRPHTANSRIFRELRFLGRKLKCKFYTTLPRRMKSVVEIYKAWNHVASWIHKINFIHSDRKSVRFIYDCNIVIITMIVLLLLLLLFIKSKN